MALFLFDLAEAEQQTKARIIAWGASIVHTPVAAGAVTLEAGA